MATPLVEPAGVVADLFFLHRPPQSKAELYAYALECLRVECETCKGAGQYWEGGTMQGCPTCGGAGSHGFHLARTAVCPGHRALLDVLWEIWSGQVRHQLWLANRSGGKTRALAVLEHLFARFHRLTISHMGAIEQQAKRVRAYLQAQTGWSAGADARGSTGVAVFGYDARSKDPAPVGLPVHWVTGEPIQWVPELTQDSTENVLWANGGAIEFLPGTMAQAAGSHRELSVLDEVDETRPEVQQKFAQTAYGPRARFIQASTYSYATGTVSKILRESPHIPVSRWCLHGDSRVATPEGEIPIRELVGRRDVWVYTLVDGRLALRRAQGIRLTRRNAPVVRVDFHSRGSRCRGSLICTPDHLLLLKTGEWRTAGALQRGDRLEPFYRRANRGQNRGWLVGRQSDAMVAEHHFVYEQTRRPLCPGEVVHHRNGDHWDNHPKNLVAWSDHRHRSYHQKRFAQDPDRETRRIAKLRDSRRRSGSPWSAEANRRAWANATPAARKRRGRAISRALKGSRKGWETFRSTRTEEEQRRFFRQRAKSAAATRERNRRERGGGPTPAEVRGRQKVWQTVRRRFSSKEISQMKAAAARGQSYRPSRENHYVGKVENAGFADVYCLTVPDTQLFFANGIAVHNCLWESIARCTYECDQAPLPDGTRGRCPLYEERSVGPDGRLQVRPLCGGELARRSDGHIPVPVAIAKRLDSNPYTFGVEWLLRSPELGMGAGLAYWAYAPENDLDFDPPIRLDAPLEWTLDFNPSHAKEMCSLVLQQAPAPYGAEWWVVDELVLPASGTAMVLREFARRYGPNGEMLPPEHPGGVPFRAGVWVSGDRSGHSPSSDTGQTDYQLVVAALRNWPDFRLLVSETEANPPLVDRLNRANDTLWDSITGRRTVRVAPRCVRFREELARQPLQPGTRQKDKSERFQRLGLTHLGDAFDYWAWKRFPYGIRPVVGIVAVPSGAPRRASAGLAPQGAPRRLSAGGGPRPAPWTVGRRGSVQEED